MKSTTIKNTANIESFTYTKRGFNNLYVVRWDKQDNEDGTCTFSETTIQEKPTYPIVVTLLIRQRYTESDELAMARQQYADMEEYMEYNSYVEWCKKEAATVMGVEYTPTYAPTTTEVLNQLRTLFQQQIESLPDDEAQNVPSLFDAWRVNEDVLAGERRYYDSKLWKSLQSHTTQASWTPDVSPSLWVRVYTEEWPEWHQPQGVQDAYMTGDKVTFEGTHYVSLIDNNTWSPAAYPQGWEARP